MIIDKVVNIKIGSKNLNHFINKNYNCKVGNEIEVNPTDLMNSSKVLINVKCDICGEEKQIEYRAYVKNTSKYPEYCCNTSCAKIKENKTKKEIYGDNYEQTRVSNMKKTNKERYGNENTSQIFRNEKNKDIFINELKEIYKEEDFDYSKINYINNYTKIEIICKEHGTFVIRPTELLEGYGCRKCKIIKIKKENLKKYIERSNTIHNNKYDYSKVIFNTITDKVTIICPIHGEFRQTLHEHTNESGCPKCAHNYNNKNWIDLFNQKHKNKYSYENFIYEKSNIKVKVNCSIHGEFKLLTSTHLKGVGCPDCANINRRLSRLERVSRDKFEGNQVVPSYNEKGCNIFNKISEKQNIHIQHAMNGGEYYIKKLGYWLDGYDIINNIAYEYDEKHHFTNGELSKKDKKRQHEIEKHLGCIFIRIKD